MKKAALDDLAVVHEPLLQKLGCRVRHTSFLLTEMDFPLTAPNRIGEMYAVKYQYLY